ncbi:MAG: hypothetical protein ACOX3W_08715 [Christensenellaceae bacterium]
MRNRKMICFFLIIILVLSVCAPVMAATEAESLAPSEDTDAPPTAEEKKAAEFMLGTFGLIVAGFIAFGVIHTIKKRRDR